MSKDGTRTDILANGFRAANGVCLNPDGSFVVTDQEVGLHATKSGLKLTFTEPLDPASLDVKNVQIKTWSLKRTADYGSKHDDEKPLEVRSAK